MNCSAASGETRCRARTSASGLRGIGAANSEPTHLEEARISLRISQLSRVLSLAAILLTGAVTSGHAQMTTEDNVQRTLESQGYKDVKDIRFTFEGITATAVKDGKQVSVLVDPPGKVMQRH